MADKNHQVLAIDDLSLGVVPNLIKKVKFIKGDVKNRKDLEKCGKDFDYIVHLAATSSAPMFEENLKYAFENNILGHINVLDFVPCAYQTNNGFGHFRFRNKKL